MSVGSAISRVVSWASLGLCLSTVGVVVGGLVGGLLGCGGDKAVRAPVSGGKPVPIVHEACDGGKVEAVDVNNDGKPDIRKHFDGSREVCRESDLDRDGRPDLYQYFTANGDLRRRESDYNDNGLPNMVEYFEGGRLVKRELDTTGRGYVDTWDTIDPASGKVVKRERDTNGKGRVDEWWAWDGEKLTIQVDKNGDGEHEADQQMLFTTAGGGLAPLLAPTSMTNGADAGAPTEPAPVATSAGAASKSALAPGLDPSLGPDFRSAGAGPSDGDGGAPKPRRGAAKR